MYKPVIEMKNTLLIFFLSTFASLAAPIRCTFVNWNSDSIALFQAYPDSNYHSVPPSIFKQTAIALSFFPELKNTKIIFELKAGGAALETMPSFWSVFKKPKDRTYHITISTKTDPLFEPILLSNLSYDAQVGVLGHELSHVADFQSYNLWRFISHAIKYTFNADYGDKFEYNTDMICIQHGLGFQLLAWSVDTRQKLDIKQIMEKHKFDMTRERYMHPESIKKVIADLPIYKTSNLTDLCY